MRLSDRIKWAFVWGVPVLYAAVVVALFVTGHWVWGLVLAVPVPLVSGGVLGLLTRRGRGGRMRRARR